MKKKSLRIILSLALCVMVMTMFSVTAFAAGDVSGAIACAVLYFKKKKEDGEK